MKLPKERQERRTLSLSGESGKARLFETANINVSVAGVEVGGVIAWIQRTLMTTRTLKFTIYEKKGVAQVSGNLKPFNIADDALRLDVKLDNGADTVDLDAIVDRLAHEIIRRRLAQDSSNPIRALKLDEFRSLVDVVKSAASYNRSVALDLPMRQEYQDLLKEVTPLADKVQRWYQLNYLAASIAESAGTPARAAEFYGRVKKALDGDAKQTKLLGEVRAKIATLQPQTNLGVDLTAAEKRIRGYAEYAIDYFNSLLNMNLQVPPMKPVPPDVQNAYWDGISYNFAPGTQSIPFR